MGNRSRPPWSAGHALLVVVGLLMLGHETRLDGADYEIGSGDALRIEVIGRPEMTDVFEVDDEGLINYWEVGRVKAAGYTTDSLGAKLTTLLIEGRYMRRPQVRISVAEYGSQRVYVAGEVQRQGYYALMADRSLRGFMSEVPFNSNAGHDVIVIRPYQAGGEALLGPDDDEPTGVPDFSGPDDGLPNPDREADEDQAQTDEDQAEDEPPTPIHIPGLPPIDPSNEVVRLNLLEMQVGGPGQNVLLQAGDTIFVPRAAQVYVTGAVMRPGAFRYEPGMTVLQALTLAGGVAARGSEGGTRVVRIEEGKKVKHKVKPTDILQPEDRLEVPERFF